MVVRPAERPIIGTEASHCKSISRAEMPYFAHQITKRLPRVFASTKTCKRRHDQRVPMADAAFLPPPGSASLSPNVTNQKPDGLANTT